MWTGYGGTASASTWTETVWGNYSVTYTSLNDFSMAEESRAWMPALRVIGLRVFGFIQQPVYHPKFAAAFWTGKNFHK